MEPANAATPKPADPIGTRRWLLGAIAVMVALKAGLLAIGAVPFNGDEAVVALMARHILQGARPVFFYGQAYLGSLDAWLIAPLFALLGEGVLPVRLVQIALYAAYLLTVWWLARLWFADRRVALFAVLIAAVPPVLITTYTTASLGGYGEAIVFGNLILGLGWLVTFGGRQDSLRHWLALGAIGGLAFWTFGIVGVYLLPVAVLGLIKFQRRLWPCALLAAGAFIAASSPWWLHNLASGNAGVEVLTGAAPRIGQLGLADRALGFVLLGLPALLGLRPPWSAEFLPPAALALMLGVHAAAAAFYVWAARHNRLPEMARGSRRLLGLFVIGFSALAIGSYFGTDSSGRYFLPLFVVLALGLAAFFAAAWEVRPWLGGLGLACVLAINLFANLSLAISPDRLSTQFDPISRFDNSHDLALMEFLRANGIARGYSNYWVTYRIAFLSGETLLFSPELPYKLDLSYTPLDVRMPQYAQAVAASPEVAYITTQHPGLDRHLRAAFAARAVTYREQSIGPYQIFFDLSRRVSPDELGVKRLQP